MKKFLLQVILLIIVIAVGIFLFQQGSAIDNLPFMPQPAVFKEVEINNNKLKVEAADTQAKRNKGLSGRQSLADNEGMLFIFPAVDKYSFWMKGLNFPLDFVWIREEKVVDLIENVPPPDPGQKNESLPIYQPKEAIDKVLELQAGTVQRLNIKVGDTIKIL